MDRVKCRMGVDSFMPSDFGFRRDLFLSQCGFCCLRQAIYHWLLCCQEVAKQYKGGRSWKGKDKMVCVLCRGICNPGGIIDCIPLRKTSDNWQRPVFSHILWCSFCACQLCPLLVGKGDMQCIYIQYNISSFAKIIIFKKFSGSTNRARLCDLC